MSASACLTRRMGKAEWRLIKCILKERQYQDKSMVKMGGKNQAKAEWASIVRVAWGKKKKVESDQAKKPEKNRTRARTERELKNSKLRAELDRCQDKRNVRQVREMTKCREHVVPVGESRLGDRRPWTLWGRSLEPSCKDIPRERLGGRPGRELKRDIEGNFREIFLLYLLNQ